jgi:hypothetical protein
MNILDNILNQSVKINLLSDYESSNITKSIILSIVKVVDSIYYKQRFSIKPYIPILEDKYCDIANNYLNGQISIHGGNYYNLDTQTTISKSQTSEWPLDLSQQEITSIRSCITDNKFNILPVHQESYLIEDICSPYTHVFRNNSGQLVCIGYHKYYEQEFEQLAKYLQLLGESLDIESFRLFCNKLSSLLINGHFNEIESYWLDYDGAEVELICWPTDTYSDNMFGNKKHFRLIMGFRDRNDIINNFQNQIKSNLYKYTKITDKYLENITAKAYCNIAIAGEIRFKPVSASILPNDGNKKKILIFTNTTRDWLLLKSIESLSLFYDYAEESYKEIIYYIYTRIVCHEFGHLLDIDDCTYSPSYKNLINELTAEIQGLKFLSDLFKDGIIENSFFRKSIVIWFSNWITFQQPNPKINWYETMGTIMNILLLSSNTIIIKDKVIIKWDELNKSIDNIYHNLVNNTSNFISNIFGDFDNQSNILLNEYKKLNYVRTNGVYYGLHINQWLETNISI